MTWPPRRPPRLPLRHASPSWKLTAIPLLSTSQRLLAQKMLALLDSFAPGRLATLYNKYCSSLRHDAHLRRLWPPRHSPWPEQLRDNLRRLNIPALHVPHDSAAGLAENVNRTSGRRQARPARDPLSCPKPHAGCGPTRGWQQRWVQRKGARLQGSASVQAKRQRVRSSPFPAKSSSHCVMSSAMSSMKAPRLDTFFLNRSTPVQIGSGQASLRGTRKASPSALGITFKGDERVCKHAIRLVCGHFSRAAHKVIDLVVVSKRL